MRQDFGAFLLYSQLNRGSGGTSPEPWRKGVVVFFLRKSGRILPIWACFSAPTSLVPSPHMRVTKPNPFRLVMTNSYDNEIGRFIYVQTSTSTPHIQSFCDVQLNYCTDHYPYFIQTLAITVPIFVH